MKILSWIGLTAYEPLQKFRELEHIATEAIQNKVQRERYTEKHKLSATGWTISNYLTYIIGTPEYVERERVGKVMRRQNKRTEKIIKSDEMYKP